MLRHLIVSALLLLPFAGYVQVASVRLTAHVPPVQNKNIYVAGSFNNWKANDSLYKMHKVNDTTYTIVLPVFKNVLYKYKYTLGQWSEVEIAMNDSSINDRSFISSGKKRKQTDNVQKWQKPKPTNQQINPQMARITAMKDSVLNELQPKLNEMLQLLKKYTMNLLQENPAIETDKQITADVVKHFTEAYGKVNDLFHKVFGSFTPEQKQKILKAISGPDADKDFINTLGSAVNDVMR